MYLKPRDSLHIHVHVCLKNKFYLSFFFLFDSSLKIYLTLQWTKKKENANLNDWFRARTRFLWTLNAQVCLI